MGALEPLLGWGLEKTQKDHFFGPSFWIMFVAYGDTFVVAFFTCFLNLSPSIFLLPQAPEGFNFEGHWPPIRSQSEPIWKSVNCNSMQEGASKSSFRGHPVVAFFMFFICVLSGAFFLSFFNRFLNIVRIRVSILNQYGCHFGISLTIVFKASETPKSCFAT